MIDPEGKYVFEKIFLILIIVVVLKGLTSCLGTSKHKLNNDVGNKEVMTALNSIIENKNCFFIGETHSYRKENIAIKNLFAKTIIQSGKKLVLAQEIPFSCGYILNHCIRKNDKEEFIAICENSFTFSKDLREFYITNFDFFVKNKAEIYGFEMEVDPEFLIYALNKISEFTSKNPDEKIIDQITGLKKLNEKFNDVNVSDKEAFDFILNFIKDFSDKEKSYYNYFDVDNYNAIKYFLSNFDTNFTTQKVNVDDVKWFNKRDSFLAENIKSIINTSPVNSGVVINMGSRHLFKDKNENLQKDFFAEWNPATDRVFLDSLLKERSLRFNCKYHKHRKRKYYKKTQKVFYLDDISFSFEEADNLFILNTF